jgi:hypothetical protein
MTDISITSHSVVFSCPILWFLCSINYSGVINSKDEIHSPIKFCSTQHNIVSASSVKHGMCLEIIVCSSKIINSNKQLHISPHHPHYPTCLFCASLCLTTLDNPSTWTHSVVWFQNLLCITEDPFLFLSLYGQWATVL